MSTSLMQIDCQRLARYDSMYARAELFNPKRVYNLLIGTAWSIVSKVDDKSSNTRTSSPSLSRAKIMSLETHNKAV